MTYEEVMDRCSIIRDTLTSGHSIAIKPTLENIEWVTMCAEAAEKQIPKKPHFEGDGYWNGEIVYDTWVCPNCDAGFETETDMHKYCPNCGQAIDWSEEE